MSAMLIAVISGLVVWMIVFVLGVLVCCGVQEDEEDVGNDIIDFDGGETEEEE